MAEIQEQPSKTIFLDRYTLYSNSAAPNGRKARLVWSVREGTARIFVFTNDPNDSDPKQMISAPIDPITFMSIMDLINKVSVAKEETRYVVDCMIPVRDGEGKMIDKTTLGQLAVGRDGQGLVWISFIAEGRPKIKFVFTSNNMAIFKKADGTAMPEGEISALTAQANVRCLVPVMTLLFKEASVDYSNRPKTPGRTGAGSYSRNAPSTVEKVRANKAEEALTDEDIPY
jgi:hypothetical protein